MDYPVWNTVIGGSSLMAIVAVAHVAVLGDPTYWPRLLHFVLAGIAFSALVTTWWAARRAAAGQEIAVNEAIARTCWKWALWATAVQVLDGFVLLLVLPREVLIGMMSGGAATLGPLMLSVFLGVGLLVMLAHAADPIANRALVNGTLATMAVVMAVMSVTRHQVPSTSTRSPISECPVSFRSGAISSCSFCFLLSRS